MSKAAAENADQHENVGRGRQPPGRRGDDPAPPRTIDPETRQRLFRLAYRFLWNRDDAEDVVQAALCAVVERDGELRDRGKWWSWICSIVVQECRLLRRRQTRWRFHWRSYAEQSGFEPDAGTHERPTELVRGLLSRLPRRQYEVLVLRDLQAMSYEEIAAVLEISPSTARVHAQAAREALRKCIRREHPEIIETRLDQRS